MDRIDARRSDLIIGIVLLASCGFMAWRTLLVRVPPSNSIAGPSFMPWIVIAGLVLLSLVLIGRAAMQVPQGDERDSIQIADRTTLVRMGLFALLMISYAAAFMTVGYLVSTLVAFVLGLLLFGERRPLMLAGMPLVATGLVYFVFTNFLNVWLP
jgi:putative tricarboxylic transport membrane protein